MSEARYQTWVKVGTAFATAVAAGSLLLQDWGPGNCFSPIRPAVKGVLNNWFGIDPANSNRELKPTPIDRR